MQTLVIVSAALLVMGAALGIGAQSDDVRAQAAGATYVGSTADGRVIRLWVSEDGGEITQVGVRNPDPWDPGGGVACTSGGGSGPWPVTDGHFEITVSVEGAYKIGDATIVGDFLPGDRVEGTYRVVWVNPPLGVPDPWTPCDTGDMPWSGQLIPPEGPTLKGETSAGHSISFTFTSDLEFATSMLIGDVDFEPQHCPDFSVASVGELSLVLDEPARVTVGQFELVIRTVVADPTPAWELAVTGVLVSETEAEGTIRVTVVEQPECDTGVLTWTATAPPALPSPTPPPSPTPIDLVELPRGGTAPPEGESSWPLWFAIGSGAFALGTLVLARRLLRPR